VLSYQQGLSQKKWEGKGVWGGGPSNHKTSLLRGGKTERDGIFSERGAETGQWGKRHERKKIRKKKHEKDIRLRWKSTLPWVTPGGEKKRDGTRPGRTPSRKKDLETRGRASTEESTILSFEGIARTFGEVKLVKVKRQEGDLQKTNYKKSSVGPPEKPYPTRAMVVRGREKDYCRVLNEEPNRAEKKSGQVEGQNGRKEQKTQANSTQRNQVCGPEKKADGTQIQGVEGDLMKLKGEEPSPAPTGRASPNPQEAPLDKEGKTTSNRERGAQNPPKKALLVEPRRAPGGAKYRRRICPLRERRGGQRPAGAEGAGARLGEGDENLCRGRKGGGSSGHRRKGTPSLKGNVVKRERRPRRSLQDSPPKGKKSLDEQQLSVPLKGKVEAKGTREPLNSRRKLFWGGSAESEGKDLHVEEKNYQ